METPIYTEKTRQFILDTLLPYKENPELCAIDAGGCLYLTKDGRKCAVGKHMKKGKWQNSGDDLIFLLESYPKEKFLTKKALSYNLTDKIWRIMQDYHDYIAHFKNTLIKIDSKVTPLEELTGLKFPELYY